VSRRAASTERGFERVVLFSDAVVAIAITLLILPVVDAAVPGQTLAEILEEADTRIVAFLLSFAVIARFWFSHHRTFERIAMYDTRLIWINMAWLASIAFLPFPTELLGVNGTEDTGICVLYVGSITLTSTCLFLLELTVYLTPAIRVGDGPPDFTLHLAALTVAALVIATVIAGTVPAIGLWALLLLPIAGVLGDWLEARALGPRAPVAS
jgi:uncharacterized membrane protein